MKDAKQRRQNEKYALKWCEIFLFYTSSDVIRHSTER